MTVSATFPNLTESGLARWAEQLAFALMPGDLVALEGDLGAGKTTFARALITSLSGGKVLEIPSPTFTLVQSYSTERFEVAHFDLYRLTVPEELLELGLDHALKRGIAIVEWPERGRGVLPEARFTLRFEDGRNESERTITLEATPDLAQRHARIVTIRNFLEASGGGGDTRVSYLQGDASARRYARLKKPSGEIAILMDSPRQADGPPIRGGLPYSRIAHLAEDVKPFVAIANALRNAGFSAPQILAQDLELGLLIIEDFGDKVFGREVASGADQKALWRCGTDALVAVRSANIGELLPIAANGTHRIPPMDQGAMQIEVELLIDWYWPALHGEPTPGAARDEYLSLWLPVFNRLEKQPKGIALRDYHSPNLIAIDGRPAPRDVGIIDFQDALWGPFAYDLVSLLQDARLDVPEATEHELLERYVSAVESRDRSFDAREFRFSYAALGAQRNTKILGIFARLAKRDGKRQYLAHIPRIWRYLERDLAHPDLSALKAWYDRHLPKDLRESPLAI